MSDLFSTLPAPLSLYILLELPDLKALYSAILSSPHLWAVFRLDARRIFRTIIARSLPEGLVTPVLVYMLTREHLTRSHNSTSLTLQQLRMVIDDVVFATTADPWSKINTHTIFHTVAQAVRIHDLAFFILRSKLDYFGTLKFEKLADPKYRYKRPYIAAIRNPGGTPMDVKMPLSDPSWAEETRAVRVLWLLAAGWRASHITTTPSDDDTEYLTAPQKMFLSRGSWGTMNLAIEIAQSILLGPVLLPPSKPRKIAIHTFDALHTYPVQSTARTTKRSAMDDLPLPSSPQFSWIPAVALDPSSEDAAKWNVDIFSVKSENPELLFTRANRLRYESPLQDSKSGSFDCLGFGFWDHRRTSTELCIRPCPARSKWLLHPSGDKTLNPDYVSRSDQMFRLYKLYKQQEQREQQGWHR
ncbi:hypothetical protein KCU85_g9724, partial [Aureobasidium melanogenum]